MALHELLKSGGCLYRKLGNQQIEICEIHESVRILEIFFKANLLPYQDEREPIHSLGDEVKKTENSSIYPEFLHELYHWVPIHRWGEHLFMASKRK